MGIIIGPIVTLLFCIFVLTRFKQGVIATAVVLQLLSYLGTGIPGVKIFSVVALVCVIMYFLIQYYKQEVKNPYPKPLVYASTLFLFSFIISEIFTRTNHHWGTIFANAITYFFFPFVLWKCIRTKKDLKYCLRLLYGLMIVAFFFAIVEIYLKKNYFLQYINNVFTLEDFSFDDSRIRFGLKRCNSIFSYFTTFGVACCMSFTVFFYMKFRYHIKKSCLLIMVFAMPFCAFATGSRAIFLGLIIMGFSLFCQDRFTHSKYFKPLLVIIIILIPAIIALSTEVVNSIIHSEEYGEGSTLELREWQLGACLPYFLNSPIIGNGRMYIWDVVAPKHSILLGAESIWFSIFVDYGLLGAIAFIYLISMCCICLWHVDKRLISIPLGYLLIMSFSPDSGVQYNVLLTFTIIHLKMYELFDNEHCSLTIRKE